MSPTFSLPLIPIEKLRNATFPVRTSLPRAERVARRGTLLHSGPMGNDGEVLSLNLSQGCAHRCAFCSARGYPTYPGDGIVRLFEDAIERLASELAVRKKKPRAVYISPSTDPFMPLAEIQEETVRAVRVLAEQGIESWLMTRGFIRPAAREALLRHKELVKVTVGLLTMDRAMQRKLEPLAAPPRMRLRQIARLRQQGLRVQVELGPLIPGVTDARMNLDPLLRGLAEIGVHQVTAGYLFLRPAIQENLAVALAERDRVALEEAFATGPMLQAGTIAAARYMPKVRRQRGYAALMAQAAHFGIRMNISALTNPDFAPVPRPIDPMKPRQRLLQF